MPRVRESAEIISSKEPTIREHLHEIINIANDCRLCCKDSLSVIQSLNSSCELKKAAIEDNPTDIESQIKCIKNILGDLNYDLNSIRDRL
jgi:hypothetical protein